MTPKREQQNGQRTSRPVRRRRSRRLLLAGVVGLGVLACVVLGVLLLPQVLSPGDSGETNPSTQATAPAPDKVIHLVAGGDINVTDKTVASGLTNGGYDYTQVFQDVLPVLSAGDVTVLNFDGIFSGDVYGSGTKAVPSQLLDALSCAGVDILQTANSYSVYGGLRGLTSTLQGIRDAGMTPVGTFASGSEFAQSGGYVIWEIQGIKVAFLAFTKGMDGMGLPAGSEDCVNLLYKDYNSTYQKVDTDGITQVVRNAAAHQPDIMVAMLHWGSELNDQISATQTKIRDLLLSEGVDAIIGTHSHYVQKMEFDREKGTFVAYSLGDFYGDGTTAGTNYSVLLDLEITKDGATGQAKVTGFDYVPIFLQTQEDNKVRILRLNDAMLAYENQYLGRVSEADYLAMKNALARIEARVGIKP